ncbi:MAG: hypothetical protein Q9168_005303 [Polycauliona sp. 1 TL-2023]
MKSRRTYNSDSSLRPTEQGFGGESPRDDTPFLIPELPESTKEQAKTSIEVAGSIDGVHQPLADADEPQKELRSLPKASQAINTNPPAWLDLSFRMVIHMPNQDRIAQRLACLDTQADVDVISQEVVDSLRLETDEYTGEAVRPLGPITNMYQPARQVTLEWNVAKFHKTYTTTFVVFNKDHSDEFDLLLGRDTIRKVNFFKKNNGIW